MSFLERIARTVRTDDEFFRTDSSRRSNGMPVRSNGRGLAGERPSVLKQLTVRNVFAWEVTYSYKKEGVYYYGINCVKLKPVVLLCARNNYILNSVYLRSLVDFENKNCVRVPLVITLPECELNQLLRRSKKALQMVCEQFHFTWCVQIKMYELGRDYFHVQNETPDERSRNQTSSRKIKKLTSYIVQNDF